MVHQTVLLQEAIQALQIKPDGIYVDATFGRGGHSRLILSHLSSAGRLIMCDQDEMAINVAKQEFVHEPRVSIIQDNFGHLESHLKTLHIWGKVDGILFDLGVSSPQLDEGERGFSFLREGPLDMRMDQSKGLPLSQQIQSLEKAELIRILREYGEEKFAPKIADAILSHPEPLKTTRELANLIEYTIPKRFHEAHKHPATRTFQALRIWLNDELGMLEQALQFFPELLAVGGQAVFISFHSLEDRLVKERIKKLTNFPEHPRGLPISINEQEAPSMKVSVKMQKPSEEEIAANPRARSAVLRAMERVH